MYVYFLINQHCGSLANTRYGNSTELFICAVVHNYKSLHENVQSTSQMFLGLVIFYSESLTGTGVFAAKITICRILHPRDVTGPVLTVHTYLNPCIKLKLSKLISKYFFSKINFFIVQPWSVNVFGPCLFSKWDSFQDKWNKWKCFVWSTNYECLSNKCIMFCSKGVQVWQNWRHFSGFWKLGVIATSERWRRWK